MIKVSIGLLIAGVLLLTLPLGKRAVNAIRAGDVTREQTNPLALEVKIPTLVDLLGAPTEAKTTTVKNTVTLEARNTVVFRGPVTGGSVGAAMKKISELSRNLSKSDKIYLVLDTPGGNILDGMDLIDFMEGIPQEIKTVTLFAASMGFQIVENNPGERLIERNGTLMSHRATGGLEGQFNGELETRYRMIKRKIDYLDTVDAKRVNLSFEDYQKKIKDEWWVHGFDAEETKVADKMVLVQCGASMSEGTDELKIDTIFGQIVVVFDKCPLIKEPIEVRMGQVEQRAQNYMNAVTNELLYDKVKFVKDIIVTNKFQSIFK